MIQKKIRFLKNSKNSLSPLEYTEKRNYKMNINKKSFNLVKNPKKPKY